MIIIDIDPEIAEYFNLIPFPPDPRAKNLPFMDNPLPTIGMIYAYLAWVLVVGPTYMRDRKPMQLTNTLFYYNLFQVALSAYMFYEVCY